MKRLPRTETLLVLACAGAAAMLGASQFTDIFHLTPPGGEALEAISSKDQHGYATLVLAIFALILILVTLAARDDQLRQVAAMAVAICGLIALLIFLIGDLPDVNKVGTLDDPRQSFIDAEAKPVAGFWLELVGVAGPHRLRRGAGHDATGSSQVRATTGGAEREAAGEQRGRRPQTGPDRERNAPYQR